MKELFSKVVDRVENLEFFNGKIISFINPYSYKILRANKALIKDIDVLLIDGISLVYLFKIFTNKKPERYSFDMTSLAKRIFEKCAKEERSVYLIGAKTEEIEKAKENIQLNFKGINIIGFRSGYFSSAEEKQQCLDDILQKKPDYLITGMGTPLQEEFLVNARHKGFQGTGFTCGGFFHQSQSGISYYPKWVDALHLRWVYRIYDEPKLFERYFVDYPKALLAFIFDVYKS